MQSFQLNVDSEKYTPIVLNSKSIKSIISFIEQIIKEE